MLTGASDPGAAPLATTLRSERSKTAADERTTPGAGRARLAKALRIEWLGQTVASLCWIASVFVYGIGSAGDWLQLGAASAWLVANLAALVASEAD